MRAFFGCFAVTLVGLCACDTTHFLSGRYSSDVLGGFDVAPDTQSELPFSGLSEMTLELILGHYGGEVAGLIKFFGPSHERCGCVKLENGRYHSSSGVVSFSMMIPESCSSSISQCTALCMVESLSAELRPTPTGLEGTYTITRGSLRVQKKLEVKKTAELKEVPNEELSCEAFDIQYPREQSY